MQIKQGWVFLSWWSRFLLVLSGFFLLLAVWTKFSGSESNHAYGRDLGLSLQPAGFSLEPEAYQSWEEGILRLDMELPKAQIPDLRDILLYGGINQRPDSMSSEGKLCAYFLLKGDDQVIELREGEAQYLTWLLEDSQVMFRFSPDNAPSSFYMEAQMSEDKASISFTLLDELGNSVASDSEFAHIEVSKQSIELNNRLKDWKLDGYRVDGGLLARQRARWYGEDLFLQLHGGEEFHSITPKQKIEFQLDGRAYSIYASEDDCFIWKESQWHAVSSRKASQGLPLLKMTKVEDKLLHFTLWDPFGVHETHLNLIRSQEPWKPDTLFRQLSYLGDRTRSQFILDLEGKRWIIGSEDWLLRQGEEWVKLDSVEEIDAFVSQEIKGPLVIIKGRERLDKGGTVLDAEIFSPSRSIYYKIYIANGMSFQQGTEPSQPVLFSSSTNKLPEEQKIDKAVDPIYERTVSLPRVQRGRVRGPKHEN